MTGEVLRQVARLSGASHARAATTSASVPVSSVGWMTGANPAEWFTGTSWATRPARSASA